MQNNVIKLTAKGTSINGVEARKVLTNKDIALAIKQVLFGGDNNK